ncbi:glycerol-3-phosphate acyltransferase [Solidesulfovibrio sp.]|mgnify:FL=1|jgi:glycerol-3-phosphate acyltransferase PlsY|uniref:glycerol-3-phosphate acyltransferase n=1 Tax=Solidesulfovibrio sp. TaxID=2910990 RepID=UPI002B1ED9C4|nr:glycerol-3-phosphate acyltransferase [Solidesulfovibrio sp.]MEA5090958.1 glycerol-3-phosphate acyltransferase [Solidesulfovibrio sp.]HML62554.1 glycerol-3-phosphate acyltransferase [Solidesulfovibrio sp.]
MGLGFVFACMLYLVLTYIVAAFPFGLAVAMAGCGIDPRLDGSRNTGATNVARLCGTRYGVATLLLDVAKGLVPVLVARAISDSAVFVSLVVVLAVAGHMFSAFLYGKGGKGVATTIGVFLGVAPVPALLAVAACVCVIALTGFVSAGSLTLAVALPVLVYFLGPCALTPAALVVAALVIAKHRENIARLRAGQEKPWRKKR